MAVSVLIPDGFYPKSSSLSDVDDGVEISALEAKGLARNALTHSWDSLPARVHVVAVQGSAKRWALGCVHPSSWLPLAAGRGGRVHAT